MVQQKLRTLRASGSALSLIAKGAQQCGIHGPLWSTTHHATDHFLSSLTGGMRISRRSRVRAAGILMDFTKRNVFDVFTIAAELRSDRGTQPLVLEDVQTLLPKVTLQEV